MFQSKLLKLRVNYVNKVIYEDDLLNNALRSYNLSNRIDQILLLTQQDAISKIESFWNKLKDQPTEKPSLFYREEISFFLYKLINQ